MKKLGFLLIASLVGGCGNLTNDSSIKTDDKKVSAKQMEGTYINRVLTIEIEGVRHSISTTVLKLKSAGKVETQDISNVGGPGGVIYKGTYKIIASKDKNTTSVRVDEVFRNKKDKTEVRQRRRDYEITKNKVELKLLREYKFVVSPDKPKGAWVQKTKSNELPMEINGIFNKVDLPGTYKLVEGDKVSTLELSTMKKGKKIAVFTAAGKKAIKGDYTVSMDMVEVFLPKKPAEKSLTLRFDIYKSSLKKTQEFIGTRKKAFTNPAAKLGTVFVKQKKTASQ